MILTDSSTIYVKKLCPMFLEKHKIRHDKNNTLYANYIFKKNSAYGIKRIVENKFRFTLYAHIDEKSIVLIKKK